MDVIPSTISLMRKFCHLYSFFFLHACKLPACIAQSSLIIKRIIGLFAFRTHVHNNGPSSVVIKLQGQIQMQKVQTKFPMNRGGFYECRS